MNETIEQSSKDTTAKRKAERRRRQREKRKLEKQCNVTSDASNPFTVEPPKPKKVITYEDLDPDQKRADQGIREWWDNQKRVGGVAEPLIIGGYSGCVDKDTEFMTESGWKKISEYREGDKVLQYDPYTDLSEMVNPLAYVKLPCEKMTYLYSQGVDQVLCDDHKFLYWTKGTTLEKGGVPRTIKFSDLKERHQNSKGWGGRIKTTFKHQGKGIDFTEGELRLQVAVNADGRVVREGKDNYTQMRFSKKRKYDRLLDICKRFGLRYKDVGCRPNDRYLSRKEYQVIVWPKTGNKRFTEEYYNATQDQLDIIAEEAHHWDGSVAGDRLEYSSNHKCDADFIQYVYATQGFNTSIYVDKRSHKYKTGANYGVSASTIRGAGYRSLTGKGTKTPMEDFYPEDGYKYCFTVPSGFLILRRNMRIFTTGNCGKTTTLSVALPALENPDGSKPKIAYAAYTGKAADVMRTKGMDASTIHYLIYNWFQTPQGLISELKDRDELDADIVVIDEASMVGSELREELESIGIPIIYTGDHGQLSPVSDNPNSADENVMMNPHFKLEKVHRQALESGIISVGVDVRTSKRVPKGVYGVNKDMIKVGSDAINDLELLNSADIFICYTNRIRNKYNAILRDLRGFEGTYPQVGEKLICTRNNREQRMFNGLIVTVESVKYEFSFLWMDLKDESGNMYYKIKVHPDYFEDGTHPKTFGKLTANYFEFGYCISGHRSQGSEWPSVVFVEEKMSMSTLEEKRRWIYTVMTRAREKCVWISKFK